MRTGAIYNARACQAVCRVGHARSCVKSCRAGPAPGRFSEVARGCQSLSDVVRGVVKQSRAVRATPGTRPPTRSPAPATRAGGRALRWRGRRSGTAAGTHPKRQICECVCARKHADASKVRQVDPRGTRHTHAHTCRERVRAHTQADQRHRQAPTDTQRNPEEAPRGGTQRNPEEAPREEPRRGRGEGRGEEAEGRGGDEDGRDGERRGGRGARGKRDPTKRDPTHLLHRAREQLAVGAVLHTYIPLCTSRRPAACSRWARGTRLHTRGFGLQRTFGVFFTTVSWLRKPCNFHAATTQLPCDFHAATPKVTESNRNTPAPSCPRTARGGCGCAAGGSRCVARQAPARSCRRGRGPGRR
jgi:hypothetical protein